MTHDSHDGQLPAEPFPHLPLTPAREVLRRETHRLDVPDNSEQLLCPSNREHAGRFFRTQLQGYGDLQVLGLIPRRLSEEKLRQAVVDDDRTVFERVSALHTLAGGASPCGCVGSSHASDAASRASPLRLAYNAARKRHHPAVARLLSDHLGSEVDWDAPLAATTRRWFLSAKSRSVIVGVLLNDIVIHRNAQLSIAPAAKSLFAHDIFIHRTGRLVQQGGYLRIWANSIHRFNDIVVSAELIAAARRTSAGWLLND